jgi:hypothetical protein
MVGPWRDPWLEDEEFAERAEERSPLAAEPYGLIRCPVCGLIRPAKWFDETVVEQQALERCTRTSLGGRRGFHVERGHALSVLDVEALQACLIAALRRLRALAEEIGADVLRVEEEARGEEEEEEGEDDEDDG